MIGDNLIYVMNHGKMARTAQKIQTSPEHRNFLIVHAKYGDWSGFRTLAECEKQFTELEGYFAKDQTRVYAVVER